MHSPLRMSARLMLLGAAFGSLVCLAGEVLPRGGEGFDGNWCQWEGANHV